MPAELVLDASVSLAWFLKETPERAAYAAVVNAAAAEGAILHAFGCARGLVCKDWFAHPLNSGP